MAKGIALPSEASYGGENGEGIVLPPAASYGRDRGIAIALPSVARYGWENYNGTTLPSAASYGSKNVKGIALLSSASYGSENKVEVEVHFITTMDCGLYKIETIVAWKVGKKRRYSSLTSPASHLYKATEQWHTELHTVLTYD